MIFQTFKNFQVFSLVSTSLILYLRALIYVYIRISQSISSIYNLWYPNPRSSGLVSSEQVWKSLYLPSTVGNFEAGYPQSILCKYQLFFPLVMDIFGPVLTEDVIPNVFHVHSKSSGMASQSGELIQSCGLEFLEIIGTPQMDSGKYIGSDESCTSLCLGLVDSPMLSSPERRSSNENQLLQEVVLLVSVEVAGGLPGKTAHLICLLNSKKEIDGISLQHQK